MTAPVLNEHNHEFKMNVCIDSLLKCFILSELWKTKFSGTCGAEITQEKLFHQYQIRGFQLIAEPFVVLNRTIFKRFHKESCFENAI